MARGSIIEPILKYITKRPGELVFATEIAADLNVTAQQVANSIWNARRSNPTLETEIQVITSGKTWRYVPFVATQPEVMNGLSATVVPTSSTSSTPASTSPHPISTSADGLRMFEEVWTTKEGTLIIKGTDGKLYRAEELK